MIGFFSILTKMCVIRTVHLRFGFIIIYRFANCKVICVFCVCVCVYVSFNLWVHIFVVSLCVNVSMWIVYTFQTIWTKKYTHLKANNCQKSEPTFWGGSCSNGFSIHIHHVICVFLFFVVVEDIFTLHIC